MSRALLVLASDPVVQRRTERVAEAAGLTAVALGPDGILAGQAPRASPPAGLIVELELPGALEAIAAWRRREPELAIVAYLVTPSAELWSQAEEAGADEVSTRGRADRVLADCLHDRLSGNRRARRLRLAPMAEFAGRLGFVGRLEETPVGPIALFHLSGRIHAVADACPHAGASLAEGELEGSIITCPRHGSQFRIEDGARLRGPADCELPTFPVVVESGVAFVELPR